MTIEYDRFSLWWTGRGLPAVPRVILDAANGFVVEFFGIDTAVGWIYFDETNTIGLVDWITTNPSVHHNKRLVQAIDHLLAFFQDFATSRGCHNMMSFVAKDTGLHRQYVKSGWQDPQSQPHIQLFRSWQ